MEGDEIIQLCGTVEVILGDKNKIIGPKGSLEPLESIGHVGVLKHLAIYLSTV